MGVVAAIIFFWSNRPNPAICNIYPTHLYTRTGTVRINTYIYISHLHSSWTPGVFYTYFYNHARRLRLEKLVYLELSRSSNGFFKYFWIQVAVSLLKPPNGHIFNGSARSGVTAMYGWVGLV